MTQIQSSTSDSRLLHLRSYFTFELDLFLHYERELSTSVEGIRVLAMLESDPRVQELDGKMISHGGGASLFSIRKLASWVLWYREQWGEERATARLVAFLSEDLLEVINTLWVIGTHFGESLDLGDGYSITAIGDMPDSGDKVRFLAGSSFRAGGPIYPVPTAAITKTCTAKKIDEENIDTAFLEERQQLHDIALIMNALPGICCLPFYATSYLPDTPFGPFASSGGYTVSYDVWGDDVQTTFLPEYQSILISLIQSYKKHERVEQLRIGRILSRLSQAKRRGQIEDKILDLGIALEMLLLNDNSSHEQLSLTFRLRGSWLLGHTPKEREAVYLRLKEVYNFRSQVAHSGNLCKGDPTKIARVVENFSIYQKYAEEIFRLIIQRGEPNWEALILDANN
jgi:hypothetical protein